MGWGGVEVGLGWVGLGWGGVGGGWWEGRGWWVVEKKKLSTCPGVKLHFNPPKKPGVTRIHTPGGGLLVYISLWDSNPSPPENRRFRRWPGLSSQLHLGTSASVCSSLRNVLCVKTTLCLPRRMLQSLSLKGKHRSFMANIKLSV